MYYLFDIKEKKIVYSGYSLDYLSERLGVAKSTLTSAYYRKTLFKKRYFVTSLYTYSNENSNITCGVCPLHKEGGIYFGCPFDIYSRRSKDCCIHQERMKEELRFYR